MKLEIAKEKPFKWIEGFAGLYLMNEDNQIKTPRIKVVSNGKTTIVESKYLPFIIEGEKKLVELSNKGVTKLYDVNTLGQAKYKRIRQDIINAKKDE